MEVHKAAGVEVVNSLAYLVGLYEQKRITLEGALDALARMTAPRNSKTQMDPFCNQGRSGDPTEGRKLMKKEKQEKTTVTERLTDEEDQVLNRLCALKKTSKTGYLARLAKDQARRELLGFAAEEYLEGRALKRAGEKDRPGCTHHYG